MTNPRDGKDTRSLQQRDLRPEKQNPVGTPTLVVRGWIVVGCVSIRVMDEGSSMF